MDLSHLGPIGEPYKYPFMGLGFPNGLLTIVFQIQRKRETLGIYLSKVHSLECYGHGLSHQTKSFGRFSSDGFRSRSIQIIDISFNP